MDAQRRVKCRNPLCDNTLPDTGNHRYCQRCMNMGYKVGLARRALKPEDLALLAMLDKDGKAAGK